MALEAGELRLTLQFANGLKDEDWFGKQDPYCIIQCGSQKVRSRTHIDGGRNPVWNETYSLQVVNENEITVTIMDADVMSRDDHVGVSHIPLAQARGCLSDVHLSVPVITKRGKQRGFLSVVVRFIPNRPMRMDHYPPTYSTAPYPVPQGSPAPPYISYQPQPIRPYQSDSVHYPSAAPQVVLVQPHYAAQVYSTAAPALAHGSAPLPYTYQQPHQQHLVYR